MKNIVNKIETLRTATAQSIIRMKPETMACLKRGELPKKDPLVIARMAGVMAAKKTEELIPYCHPIPLDNVEVEFVLGEDQITVQATVMAIWKTGVEMEALTAASVASLTLYDMLKAIDTEMEIVETKLLSKKGGKSEFVQFVPNNFRAAVLVISDGTYQGKRADKSGKIIQEKLQSYSIHHIDYSILPDEVELIRHDLLKYCENGVDLILTTGGTGLGPRDVTVEATQTLIERETPAVMQAIRHFGQRRTPYAMLSRGLAGIHRKSLIINLPGSSRGVSESMDAIFPAILHLYPILEGGGH